jgi:hypothetical protein
VVHVLYFNALGGSGGRTAGAGRPRGGMIPVLLLILAAAPSRVDLLDDKVDIPASDWRYVEFNVKQQPVTIGCDYTLISGGRGIRVALLTRHELDNRRAGRPWSALASTRFSEEGRLRFRLRQPGGYAILIDNSGRGATAEQAHVTVFMDFSARGEPDVQELSRTRQLVVILVSFLFFIVVVSYSAHRLMRGIKKGQ